MAGIRTFMPTRDTARYREAAEMAIAQLDWCIDYLHRIRKRRIAATLKHNRDAIVRDATAGRRPRGGS
jgi:hypothetical protein